MEKGESSGVNKRKHSDDDDGASPSHRSMRAKTSSEPPSSPEWLSLQLALFPSLPLFDLNSPPPPESPPESPSHSPIPSPPPPESPSHSPIPSPPPSPFLIQPPPPPLDDAPPPPPPLDDAPPPPPPLDDAPPPPPPLDDAPPPPPLDDAPPPPPPLDDAPPPPPPQLVRRRRNPSKGPREGKSETVPPPFPWATDRRANVHSLNHLVNNNITTITGHAQCKRCDQKFTLEFDLKEKFCQVLKFVIERKGDMHTRAPEEWMNPKLLDCENCKQESCVKPIIIPKNKKCMNWLFLLLGQWIGLCSLADLKYFCKHTGYHRTGAKDRVLYTTYITLCRQLCPHSPFQTYHILQAELDELRRAREQR